ncbi:auxin-responsive protein SAUR71-like [Typha latifolia]|uniref:auxin-responsive protein SAUR71-like n=1 Tax=Typha latifolia TaxID=4733 RepID=UPI003C2CB43D
MKNIITKTLERCKSIKAYCKKERRPEPQEGCFTVCVGGEKARFVVRMECVNHPLFRMLLEEAETEYGYVSGGPLELPCDVDFFLRVLWEMEAEAVEQSPRYGFGKGHAGYQLMSPARPMVVVGRS